MARTDTREFTVRANEVDIHRRATLPAIVNYMQEAAWFNTVQLDASVYDLQEKGITWVMHRMRLELTQYPVNQEKVRVETWPAGGERVFVYRDYRIYNERGEPIGQASSSWAVLDIGSRRLTAIPAFLQDLIPPPEGKHPLPRATGKWPEPDSFPHTLDIHVGWFALDPNHHVNNAFYFQWMVEAMPESWLGQYELGEIDIQIRQECALGDHLSAQAVQTAPHQWIHRILRNADQKLIAQARTTWRQS
jgi:acyl-ACP thioesterase